MSRVPSTELKSHLGKHLRAVRAGQDLVVTDRDEPVARLIPYRPDLEAGTLIGARPADPAAPPLGAVQVRGLHRPDLDSTALLRAERDRR